MSTFEGTKFKGFVARLNKKEGQGRKGPWTAYSVKIEKEDGSEYPEWVSLGFDAPPFKEGDYIRLYAAQQDGRMQLTPGSAKVLGNAPARKTKEKPASTGGGKSWGGAGGFNKGPRKGDGINDRTNPVDAARMTYQASRSNAIEIVRLLIEQEALPMSSAKGKAGEAKRQEEILAYLDKLTVEFYNDALSLRLLETVEDAGAVGQDTKADGPLPGSDGEDDGDDEDAAAEASDEDDEDEDD